MYLNQSSAVASLSSESLSLMDWLGEISLLRVLFVKLIGAANGDTAALAALDAAEIDDPVGAFSVHGVCGVWGTLVVGLWGFDLQGDGSALGFLVGGGIDQFFVQALGCAAYAIWTLVTCWLAWSIIGGLFGGIRVSESEEIQGLDIGEHGMEAYPDFASVK